MYTDGVRQVVTTGRVGAGWIITGPKGVRGKVITQVLCDVVMLSQQVRVSYCRAFQCVPGTSVTPQ